VAAGASGSGVITLSPANGYTGTVNLAISPTTLTNGCVVITPSVAVSGTTSVASANYTVYTSSSSCATVVASAHAPGGRVFMFGSHATVAANSSAAPSSAAPRQPNSPWQRTPLPATLAGTLLLVCFRRRSGLLRASLALGLLLMLACSGIGLTGCSSGSTGTTTPPPVLTTPAGNYTLTITGTDSKTSTLTSSASVVVTVS
jgi:hypothetical protein